MTPDLKRAVAAELDWARSTRHDLHRHPELSFQERRTSALVARELTALGLRTVANLGAPVPGPPGTGVIALLPATHAGANPRTVALRADMDALPITEATGAPYASTNPGVMHACGHDGHTTILLTAARVLSKVPDRPNNVVFLFQPAEEGGAGAEKLCRDGALDGRVLGVKVDQVYGLHTWPDQPLGTIAVRNGPMLAATDDFILRVHGRGGHAAQPHLGADPVLAAAHLITALQSVVSRNISPFEPAVLTVATVHAGTANNIIPDTVELTGTLRTLSPEARALGESAFRRVVENICAAMGCRAEINWHRGYPVTVNDPAATDRVRRVAASVVGPANLIERPHPTMGGEDFSYYGTHAPASFFFLGQMKPKQASAHALHTPQFDFCDEALGVGTEMMAGLALIPVG